MDGKEDRERIVKGGEMRSERDSEEVNYRLAADLNCFPQARASLETPMGTQWGLQPEPNNMPIRIYFSWTLAQNLGVFC